jgi:hypothetical protein
VELLYIFKVLYDRIIQRIEHGRQLSPVRLCVVSNMQNQLVGVLSIKTADERRAFLDNLVFKIRGLPAPNKSASN